MSDVDAVKMKILQSARVAELRRVAMLVKPRPIVKLSRNQRMLRMLLAAERRRCSELIELMK